MREWQIASGNFVNRNTKKFGKSFYIDRDGIENTLDMMINSIKKQKGKIISINDGPMSDEQFEETVQLLKQAFEVHLSKKSSFEK